MADNPLRIQIDGFDPLRLTLPEGVDTVVGEVLIVLPELRVQVMDLSFGFSLLEGMQLVTDQRLYSIGMDIPEPGVTIGEVVEMLHKGQHLIKDIWESLQQKLVCQGPLLNLND